MPSLTELKESVFSVVRDTARTFVTEEDVDKWLREAMTDLSSRLRLVQNYVEDTTDGTNQIALPSDYMDLIWLQVPGSGTNDDYVTWVDENTWNAYSEQGADSATIGRVFNGNIEVYPTPDTGTAYTLRYWATNSNSLTGFSGSLQIRMVNYAVYRAKLKEGEPAIAREYLDEYERGLPPPNNLGSNAPILPDRISIEAGPFDTSEAKHI